MPVPELSDFGEVDPKTRAVLNGRHSNHRVTTYTKGVLAIQRGDYQEADRPLRQAAKGGHVSALFNLGLLHGAGDVSPMDPDFAIECLYKAADAGHPKAQELKKSFLEPADRGSYGTVNLIQNASYCGPDSGMAYIVMLNACRFIDILCRQHNATDQVIAYELDGASHSEYPMVHRYIERTGIPAEFYEDGLNSLEAGCAADEITDVLNQFSVAMTQAGFDQKTVIFFSLHHSRASDPIFTAWIEIEAPSRQKRIHRLISRAHPKLNCQH